MMADADYNKPAIPKATMAKLIRECAEVCSILNCLDFAKWMISHNFLNNIYNVNNSFSLCFPCYCPLITAHFTLFLLFVLRYVGIIDLLSVSFILQLTNADS